MADQDSIYCPNCSRGTSLTRRARYIWPKKTWIHYEIAECNNCDFFFLIMRQVFDDSSSILRIFPDTLPEPIHEKTPEFLKQDLQEARNCFSIGAYRATGTMARRALQLCCIQKGAPKKRLQEQVEWLLANQIITKDLKDWADEVRLTGNDAAHPPQDSTKDEIVTSDDAKDILTLLEEFIKVLYIAPSLAKERKQIRDKNRNQQ